MSSKRLADNCTHRAGDLSAPNEDGVLVPDKKVLSVEPAGDCGLFVESDGYMN
jgi:hypothetical protein